MEQEELYIQRDSEQEFNINLGDISIEFGKLGINEITHPVSITHSDTFVQNSDWISPYVSGTVTNGELDSNLATVGGNHGTDGGGGFPTANSVSTSVLIGDREVPQDGEKHKFDKVEVVTINHITNKANINLETGERLKVDFIETVRYTLERNHMAVEVEIEAVEDIYINWYMGLQLIRSAWKNDAFFAHDLSQTELYTQSAEILNSGTKGESPNLSRVVMRNGVGDVAHVYMDKDFGVGYSHISDSDPVMYLRENFGKMYFHLIKRPNNLVVSGGEKVGYQGGYIFGKNKAKNATNVTYFTENGVNKAYVDFKVTTTEDIDFTSVEESFNCTFGENYITSTEPNAYAKVII